MWTRPRTESPTAPRTRLGLESLETRDVPATFFPTTAPDLVAAIAAANQTPEADTITLAPGTTYSLVGVNNTTHGATGLPVIATGSSVTILGNGATVERAAGAPAFRLLDVAAGASLSLQNLTLTGGEVVGSGGAVYSFGALSMTDCLVKSNSALGAHGRSGGGRVATNGGPGGDAFGGGVYVGGGTADLTRVALRGNTSRGGDGGAGGSDPNDGGSGGGAGGSGYGGGVYVGGGIVSLRSVSLTGNVAEGGDGGAGGSGQTIKGNRPGGPGGAGGDGYGGGAYVAGGTVALLASSVTKNAATAGTGGLGGAGKPKGASGATGSGIGGGVYIEADAAVALDVVTLVTGNTAATKGPNVYRA